MRKYVRFLLPLLLLMAGLSVLCYPRISAEINRRHSTRAIQTFTQQVENTPQNSLTQLLDEAEVYNQALRAGVTDLFAEAAPEYQRILSFDDGMMGYLSIPAIGTELPIYHGTGSAVLAKGAGHMPQTAFPIGGIGNHAVLVGHTGLPSAPLFTHLTQLNTGDVFHITIAGRKLTYTVDQICTVLPWDTALLLPQEDKDLCTLVTCTPYGINSHRLLVRGVRTDHTR